MFENRNRNIGRGCLSCRGGFFGRVRIAAQSHLLAMGLRCLIGHDLIVDLSIVAQPKICCLRCESVIAKTGQARHRPSCFRHLLLLQEVNTDGGGVRHKRNLII